MTQKTKQSLVLQNTFFLVALLVFLAAPSNSTTSSSLKIEESAPNSVLEDSVLNLEVETPEMPEVETPEMPEVETPEVLEAAPQKAEWLGYPNVCETFTVTEGENRIKDPEGKLVYPLRFKRNRYDRKRSHQKRTRELVRMVAKEMGADREGQYLLDMIAHHESSWNPEAIHILNPDLAANVVAWERHSYDRGRELALLDSLDNTSAKTKEFWRTKSELADLRLYKNNPFWNAQLEYLHQIPERTLHQETTPALEFTEHRSVWAYGYGLFGMNSVLFVHIWDNQAPPWVLCGDEGIVATVTAIWALREQQSDCSVLTGKDSNKYGSDGGNARGIIRRFARGHCSDAKLGPVWQRLMKDYSDQITWDRSPDLGDKFPRYEMVKRKGKWEYQYEKELDPVTGEPKLDESGSPVYKRDERGRKIKVPTDRQAILAHMRIKAEEEGLLRPQPLKRKNPDIKPVMVNARASTASP